MATITTSQDFDSAARSAGEAFAVNSGAILTINTDTRWHKNAPSGANWGMGSIGGGSSAINLTAATGGTVLIDARNVRWIPFTSGSGNVPTLGSTISGNTSGASGELLGVYSSLNAAPIEGGQSMPASGFLKFKSVSNGPFNSSESLSGISASTNGAETTGWIEVVMDDASAVNVSRPGFFQTRGDWFYLDTTNGNIGQIIQCPNPGGSNTRIAGVWIETGVGTNEYEFWPAQTGTSWTTSCKGTDERNKFVEMLSDGQIRIGSDGTNNLGYVPASGCKVRIPNIFLMSCATTTRNLNSLPNTTPATRPDFTTTSAGNIDMEFCIGHWYPLFSQAYSVKMSCVALLDAFSITECATSIILTDVHNGNYLNSDVAALTLTSNFAGGVITSCKFGRGNIVGSADYSVAVTYCIGFQFMGCHFQTRSFRSNAAGYAFYGGYNSNLTFTNTVLVGHALYLIACMNSLISDTIYMDSLHTTSSATGAIVGAININAGCVNTKIQGVGWFSNISNIHPDGSIVYVLGATNTRIQNIGSRSSPLSGGSSNIMLYVISDGGNNYNIEVKRVYCSEIATRFYNGINSSKLILIENCAADYADTMGTSGTAGFVVLAGYVKNLASSAAYTAYTSVYGTIFYNLFTSLTEGRLGLMFNEPIAEQADYVETSFTGASGYTSTGLLALLSANDYVIYEFPYWIYGVDSFQNLNVVLSGVQTGNQTIEYQIDTGSGWNGTWKAATGANLAAESFNAIDGFRLKIRITCNTASTANTLSGLYLRTSADADAQDVQYPLDTYTLTLTGLQTNTKVAIVESGTETVIGNVYSENSGQISFVYPDTMVNDVVDIAILAPGNLYQRINGYSLGSLNAEIPIVQQTDFGYDGSLTAAITFDGANKRINCDVGTLELNMIGVYSEWVAWALTENNLRFNPAFSEIGGNDIDLNVGTKIPVFCFLINSWRLKPQEANHTLSVSGGILLVSGGGNPFVNTTGSFVVQINYQQPVQVLTVATGGSSGGGDATLANQTSMLALLELLKKMADDNQALSISMK